MFHSVLDLLLKIPFWAKFYSSYFIILWCIWLRTVLKGTWTEVGEKRVGVYQNNKRNESVTLASKRSLINLENQWKRSHIFGKSSFLDREPSTMIPEFMQSLPTDLRALLSEFLEQATPMIYWCSNSEIFVDVWLSLEKSVGEFSMVYKKMSALIWLRAYSYDFVL